MKTNTKRRKKARKGFRQIYGENELANKMFHIIQTGKHGLDAVILELGKMVAEAIHAFLVVKLQFQKRSALKLVNCNEN